jgi:hypothetical protein
VIEFRFKAKSTLKAELHWMLLAEPHFITTNQQPSVLPVVFR